MFVHNKRLQYTVHVEECNPGLANLMLEQWPQAVGASVSAGSMTMARSWGGLRRVGGAATLAVAALLAGCGGGAEVSVGEPVLGALDIVVAQVGPNAVRVDWSGDPYVATFAVYRNDFVLADHVDALSLVDTLVPVGNYCYHVDGYDVYGHWVAVSETACLTVLP